MRRIPREDICRASAASRTCAGPRRLPVCGSMSGSTRAMRSRPSTIRCWARSSPGANRAPQRSIGCGGAWTTSKSSGVTTNRALLSSVLADEEFRRGGGGDRFSRACAASSCSFGEPRPPTVDAVLAGAVVRHAATRTAMRCGRTRRGWRLAAPAAQRRGRSRSVSVAIELAAPIDTSRACAGREYRAAGHRARRGNRWRWNVDGQVQRLRVVEARSGAAPVSRRAPRGRCVCDAHRGCPAGQRGAAEQGSLLTPLPGTIVAVHVAAGQHVARGAPLVTVEAMKMEHTLTAPYDGIVTRIAFGVAERVAAGAILVELAPLEA